MRRRIATLLGMLSAHSDYGNVYKKAYEKPYDVYERLDKYPRKTTREESPEEIALLQKYKSKHKK